jgi:hypothetical protein
LTHPQMPLWFQHRRRPRTPWMQRFGIRDPTRQLETEGLKRGRADRLRLRLVGDFNMSPL